MSGQTFYDDLHILDLERNAWTNVRKKRTNPPPRAAHDGLFYNQAIYMFGGMSGAGALDDAYKLNLGVCLYGVWCVLHVLHVAAFVF